MVRHQAEEAYDLIAQEYAVRHQAMPPRIVELGERFLGYLTPGSRILDVGCGSCRDMACMEAEALSHNRDRSFILNAISGAEARVRRGQVHGYVPPHFS